MKKRISVLYEGCVCITVVFLIFMFFYSENDLYVKGNTQDYRRMVNHSYLVREDKSAPVGIREIYVIHPSEIPKDSNALVFRTIHQNVEVFLDDRLVFQLEKTGYSRKQVAGQTLEYGDHFAGGPGQGDPCGDPAGI